MWSWVFIHLSSPIFPSPLVKWCIRLEDLVGSFHFQLFLSLTAGGSCLWGCSALWKCKMALASWFNWLCSQSRACDLSIRAWFFLVLQSLLWANTIAYVYFYFVLPASYTYIFVFWSVSSSIWVPPGDRVHVSCVTFISPLPSAASVIW